MCSRWIMPSNMTPQAMPAAALASLTRKKTALSRAPPVRNAHAGNRRSRQQGRAFFSALDRLQRSSNVHADRRVYRTCKPALRASGVPVSFCSRPENRGTGHRGSGSLKIDAVDRCASRPESGCVTAVKVTRSQWASDSSAMLRMLKPHIGPWAETIEAGAAWNGAAQDGAGRQGTSIHLAEMGEARKIGMAIQWTKMPRGGRR